MYRQRTEKQSASLPPQIRSLMPAHHALELEDQPLVEPPQGQGARMRARWAAALADAKTRTTVLINLASILEKVSQVGFRTPETCPARLLASAPVPGPPSRAHGCRNAARHAWLLQNIAHTGAVPRLPPANPSTLSLPCSCSATSRSCRLCMHGWGRPSMPPQLSWATLLSGALVLVLLSTTQKVPAWYASRCNASCGHRS